MRHFTPFLMIAMMSVASIAGELSDLLPSKKDIPKKWEAAGEYRSFEGKALYQHINGGAELFHKHGFRRLCLQDYVKRDSDKKLEARIEIYAMESAQGADDIFAANTPGIQKNAKFGEICTVDDMQIILKRGHYYVTVTGYETGEEVRSALASFASAVDLKICQVASESLKK